MIPLIVRDEIHLGVNSCTGTWAKVNLEGQKQMRTPLSVFASGTLIRWSENHTQRTTASSRVRSREEGKKNNMKRIGAVIPASWEEDHLSRQAIFKGYRWSRVRADNARVPMRRILHHCLPSTEATAVR